MQLNGVKLFSVVYGLCIAAGAAIAKRPHFFESPNRILYIVKELIASHRTQRLILESIGRPVDY